MINFDNIPVCTRTGISRSNNNHDNTEEPVITKKYIVNESTLTYLDNWKVSTKDVENYVGFTNWANSADSTTVNKANNYAQGMGLIKTNSGKIYLATTSTKSGATANDYGVLAIHDAQAKTQLNAAAFKFTHGNSAAFIDEFSVATVNLDNAGTVKCYALNSNKLPFEDAETTTMLNSVLKNQVYPWFTSTYPNINFTGIGALQFVDKADHLDIVMLIRGDQKGYIIAAMDKNANITSMRAIFTDKLEGTYGGFCVYKEHIYQVTSDKSKGNKVGVFDIKTGETVALMGNIPSFTGTSNANKEGEAIQICDGIMYLYFSSQVTWTSDDGVPAGQGVCGKIARYSFEDIDTENL